jgi:hypothetical protein
MAETRGRPSGLQGAAHRAARDSPAGCPGPRRPLRPLGPARAAGPGLPRAARGAQDPAAAGHRSKPDVRTQVKDRPVDRVGDPGSEDQ